MVEFTPAVWMRAEIESIILKENRNKATVMDAIQNGMLQLKPSLMAELLFEVWKLVGKSREERITEA